MFFKDIIINDYKAVAGLLKSCYIMPAQSSYTAEYHQRGLFLFNEGKNELGHPLSLVSVCLAKSDPVSPRSLQCGVTYVNYQSRHHYNGLHLDKYINFYNFFKMEKAFERLSTFLTITLSLLSFCFNSNRFGLRETFSSTLENISLR